MNERKKNKREKEINSLIQKAHSGATDDLLKALHLFKENKIEVFKTLRIKNMVAQKFGASQSFELGRLILDLDSTTDKSCLEKKLTENIEEELTTDIIITLNRLKSGESLNLVVTFLEHENKDTQTAVLDFILNYGNTELVSLHKEAIIGLVEGENEQIRNKLLDIFLKFCNASLIDTLRVVYSNNNDLFTLFTLCSIGDVGNLNLLLSRLKSKESIQSSEKYLIGKMIRVFGEYRYIPAIEVIKNLPILDYKYGQDYQETDIIYALKLMGVSEAIEVLIERFSYFIHKKHEISYYNEYLVALNELNVNLKPTFLKALEQYPEIGEHSRATDNILSLIADCKGRYTISELEVVDRLLNNHKKQMFFNGKNEVAFVLYSLDCNNKNIINKILILL
ncbi:MAG: hypothetical protein IPJ82_00010 [Lewinellaceae bacterium]|nr:hypothetical protein [Lewinellaceae bacterium]